MGVTKIEDMPEFSVAKAEIESYKNTSKEEEKENIEKADVEKPDEQSDITNII